ncbi:head completion/stabilization protein [Algicola sagamiensis]|uniref:head completion/stabilization protein n=1 Tax=Algicola sagamiensis TaxID=163869 RepID=UPI00036F66DC|nr:head completion/stabilization protein [Algicola sagamiensis]
MDFTAMPKASPDSHIVTNDGFYPDLDTAELIQQYAVETEFSMKDEMLVYHLTLATHDVNQLLRAYRLQQGDKTDWLNPLLYKHAVYSLAKAQLLFSRFGTTHRDQRAAQQLQASDNEPYWRENSMLAIRKLQGISPTFTVSLL